jgi:DNA-binding NtrC family response regulator
MSQSNHNAAAPIPSPLLFVVDDEPMLLELAGMILGPEGFDVRTFRNPATAVEAFRKSAPRPALIITDYAMHTMHGLDLIKACRRIEPRQKIILVSGTVDETVYLDSPVKPDRFLAKPFQTKKLVELVRAVLAE